METFEDLEKYRLIVLNIFKKFLFCITNSEENVLEGETIIELEKIADYWSLNTDDLKPLEYLNKCNNSISNDLYVGKHLDMNGDGLDLVGVCWHEYIMHQHNIVLMKYHIINSSG